MRPEARVAASHGENGGGPRCHWQEGCTVVRLQKWVVVLLAVAFLMGVFAAPALADEAKGKIKSVAADKNQIVVTDNLRAHHSPEVRAAIEARGARFLPLPAYSSDFNPIEAAFAKVKQALRRAAARPDDALRDATWAAFATITPADAAGWFTHCGYEVA